MLRLLNLRRVKRNVRDIKVDVGIIVRDGGFLPSRRVNASCVGVVPTASKTARGKPKSRANGGQKTWVATVRLCVTRLRVAVVAGKEIIVVLKRLQIVDAMGQSTDDRGVVRLLNGWPAHDLAGMSLHIDASKTLTGLCIHAGHGLIASRHARQKAIIRLHHRLNVGNLLQRQTKAGRRAAVVFTYATTAIAFIWSCAAVPWFGLFLRSGAAVSAVDATAVGINAARRSNVRISAVALGWANAIVSALHSRFHYSAIVRADARPPTATTSCNVIERRAQPLNVAHEGACPDRSTSPGVRPTHTTKLTGTKAGRRRAHIWDARRGRRSRRRSRARRGCGRRCA